MMRVSTKGRYATRIMIYLALNGQKNPVRKKEVAKYEGLSADYVEQILTKLKTANLVHSQRGKHGGFILAKDTKDITINDIITATEGPIILVDCASEKCGKSAPCVSSDVWQEASDAINKIFSKYTLAEMVKRTAIKNSANALSFEI
jgi:Rrf2 family protein